MGHRRPIGQKTGQGDAGGQGNQQSAEHARRGACAEGEAPHALQIAPGPQREQGNRHEDDASDIILRRPDRHEQRENSHHEQWVGIDQREQHIR